MGQEEISTSKYHLTRHAVNAFMERVRPMEYEAAKSYIIEQLRIADKNGKYQLLYQHKHADYLLVRCPFQFIIVVTKAESELEATFTIRTIYSNRHRKGNSFKWKHKDFKQAKSLRLFFTKEQ